MPFIKYLLHRYLCRVPQLLLFSQQRGRGDHESTPPPPLRNIAKGLCGPTWGGRRNWHHTLCQISRKKEKKLGVHCATITSLIIIYVFSPKWNPTRGTETCGTQCAFFVGAELCQRSIISTTTKASITTRGGESVNSSPHIFTPIFTNLVCVCVCPTLRTF